MKNLNLDMILSVFALLFGVLFCISPFIVSNFSDPSLAFSLLLGGSLSLYGSYHFWDSIKAHLFIKNQTKASSILAHWTYESNTSPFITSLILEKRSHTLSIIVSLCILGLFIAFGFYLSNPIKGLVLGALLSIFILIGCCILCFITYHYYKQKLKSPIEIFIDTNSIYFFDTLYFTANPYHPLELVKLTTTPPYILLFMYTTYGTTVFYPCTITFPIAEADLSLAQSVAHHYQKYAPK